MHHGQRNLPRAGPVAARLDRESAQTWAAGDKHVPDVYLLAGTSQRGPSCRGLMDTDGTISRSQGQTIFTSTKEELADAVAYLARSLGWRVGRSAGRAMLDGKDCGPRFTVQFTPKTCDGFSPFRLARKGL